MQIDGRKLDEQGAAGAFESMRASALALDPPGADYPCVAEYQQLQFAKNADNLFAEIWPEWHQASDTVAHDENAPPPRQPEKSPTKSPIRKVQRLDM